MFQRRIWGVIMKGIGPNVEAQLRTARLEICSYCPRSCSARLKHTKVWSVHPTSTTLPQNKPKAVPAIQTTGNERACCASILLCTIVVSTPMQACIPAGFPDVCLTPERRQSEVDRLDFEDVAACTEPFTAKSRSTLSAGDTGVGMFRAPPSSRR